MFASSWSLRCFLRGFRVVFRVVFASFFASLISCRWGKLRNLSLCFSSGVAVSMGEGAKPLSDVAVSMREAAKPCKTSVSACPLASPCVWGKLQNRVAVSVQNLRFCLSSGVAVSMGEAAKPRSFCCAHVAVSSRVSACPRCRVYGGSCKTSFVLLRSRRRVYGGSCKTYLVSSFCLSSGVTASIGKAAKHRLFCCTHVAVSRKEAAKLQSRLEFLLVLWRRRVYRELLKSCLD